MTPLALTTGKLLRQVLRGYAERQPALDGQAVNGSPVQVPFVPETDREALLQSAHLLESLFPTWVVMLCIIQHPSVGYLSGNTRQVLGYPREALLGLSPEESFALIHPQDSYAVSLTFAYMRKFTSTQAGYDPVKYRFLFHYRLRHPKGHYQYILDEKLAVVNQGNRRVYFTLFHNATSQRTFTGVKLEIYQHLPQGLAKLTEYRPQAEPSSLTGREREIILLMSKGLSVRAMSEALTISYSTVKNHRNNIFRKLQVKSALELLHLARQQEWI
jgi:DNA-binding CsgD family transcriptional regulator